MRGIACVLAVATALSNPALGQDFAQALAARDRVELACAAALKPVHSKALSDKVLFSLSDKRPELLTSEQYPSPAEIAALRAYMTVWGGCFDDLRQWASTYIPGQVPLTARTRADMLVVLGDLSDRLLTYGQANRRLLVVWTNYEQMLAEWAAPYRR